MKVNLAAGGRRIERKKIGGKDDKKNKSLHFGGAEGGVGWRAGEDGQNFYVKVQKDSEDWLS